MIHVTGKDFWKSEEVLQLVHTEYLPTVNRRLSAPVFWAVRGVKAGVCQMHGGSLGLLPSCR